MYSWAGSSLKTGLGVFPMVNRKSGSEMEYKFLQISVLSGGKNVISGT